MKSQTDTVHKALRTIMRCAEIERWLAASIEDLSIDPAEREHLVKLLDGLEFQTKNLRIALACEKAMEDLERPVEAPPYPSQLRLCCAFHSHGGSVLASCAY